MLSNILATCEVLDWQKTTKLPHIQNFRLCKSITLHFSRHSSTYYTSVIRYSSKIKGNKHCRIEITHTSDDSLLITREISDANNWWSKKNDSIKTVLCRTEEQYFMESTLVDFRDISLRDMERMVRIFDKLSKMMLHGK